MSKDEITTTSKQQITITDIKQHLPITKIDIPFQKEIYLFTSHIAGTSYIDHIDEYIQEVKENERLKFVREENNKYDDKAIRIENSLNHKLGYVPKKDNVIFSRLMDAGKLLFGKITEIKDFETYYYISIDIYLLD